MKKLLIISYYANMPGAYQAEWIDDKLDSIDKESYSVDIITSSCAAKYDQGRVNHWRTPSLSLSDYYDELLRVKNAGRKFRYIDWLMLPFALTFGLLIDLMQYVVTKGLGEGRWSWAVPSWVMATLVCIINRPDKILSTGGPASAHLAALLTGKLFNLPVIVELQDPLSGDGIGINSQARGWLYKVEKLIVQHANKIVYVTESAATFARRQFSSRNIVGIYPGARKFNVKRSLSDGRTCNKFRIVHLGSLYATRNFDTIIAAIDKLILSNQIDANYIELVNLGHVAPHIRNVIETKNYVKIQPPVSRAEALEFAINCDATLLIQNSDDRSNVTIPYKTYDYLNLGIPVVALLNSDELTSLITSAGHKAFKLEDVNQIAIALCELINNRSAYICSIKLNVDPVAQVNKLLEIL